MALIDQTVLLWMKIIVIWDVTLMGYQYSGRKWERCFFIFKIAYSYGIMVSTQTCTQN
jgi:hypothetical protein